MAFHMLIHLVGFPSTVVTTVVSKSYPVTYSRGHTTQPRSIEGSDFSVQVDIHFQTVQFSPSTISGGVDLSIIDPATGTTVASNNTFVRPPAGTSIVTLWVTVPSPTLWWPRGYGSPYLYTLQTSFTELNNPSDVQVINTTIGFRSVELVTDPIGSESGKYFYFKINGLPIFVKGANFIPADSFEKRSNASVLQVPPSECVHDKLQIISFEDLVCRMLLVGSSADVARCFCMV